MLIFQTVNVGYNVEPKNSLVTGLVDLCVGYQYFPLVVSMRCLHVFGQQ